MYYRLYFKRILDIVLSSIILVCISPLLLLIILSIICVERTFKIFYISIRIGQHGKAFKIYKFRTMKINCYQKEIFDKQKDDDRITKLGSILRKTSLDELLQFFNVLKGDMSIVGNRPLPIKEASYFYRQNNQRFSAPAGITGLWQINKHTAQSIEQRNNLDIIYSNQVNFKTDLLIMIKTPQQMFKNY